MKLNNFLIIYVILLLGCYAPDKSEIDNGKFLVVSNFNEIILKTNDEKEAYKTAHNLTLISKIFHKGNLPCSTYFVKESK